MANCKDCVHYELCRRIDYELEYHNKSIKEAEEELPIKCRFFKNKTDVVPVVRCKDCKYYEIHKPSVTLNCERGGRLVPMMPDDYCSYGDMRVSK